MAELQAEGRPSGVSVVIPAFGRLAELQRAIESVTTDRPRAVEIVVIDDASASELRRELPTHNRSGVPLRAYRFERNRGPQAARNLGLRRARFSHVAFLDSDDVFLPGKVDAVLRRLDNEPFELLFHAVEGLPRYAMLGRLWQRRLRALLPFHWLLALYNPVPTPSLVVRRVCQVCRLGPAQLRHSEDWAFLLRYVQPGQHVIYLDQPLAAVSRPAGAAGGLSADRWRMRRGEFSARRVLLASPRPGNLLRFAVGSIVGALRVLADLLRGRYWR